MSDSALPRPALEHLKRWETHEIFEACDPGDGEEWVKWSELAAVLSSGPQEQASSAFVSRAALARLVVEHREAWNAEYVDDFGHSKLDNCLEHLEDFVRLNNASVGLQASPAAQERKESV